MPARNEQSTAARTVGSATGARLEYIDNLRVLLTVLVILLHLSIGYGAPGDWYYNEAGDVSTVSEIGLTLFVAINQAFFMGFFFLVSSYFSPGSLDRKGAGGFLRDRFKRLGIPIVVYALVLNPLLVALLVSRESPRSFGRVLVESYTDLIGVGPTWFLEALLLFSIGLVVWRRIRSAPAALSGPRPLTDSAIARFALALGLITFVLRIWVPVGWWWEPVHFQLAHFPQYVGLFAVGVVARHRGWFDALTELQRRRWLGVVLGLVAVFPVLFVAGGALDGELAVFLGGAHWQQLAYSLWEQFMCVAMVVTLLVWYRRRFNQQKRLGRATSKAAYATYVLHAPIITVVAIGLSGIRIDLGVKFVLVAPLAVGASFLVGYLVKQLPVARDIV